MDVSKLDPGELCGRTELDNSSMRYDPDDPLDNVSLRIEPRELIGTYSVPSVTVSVECWAVELAREKGERVVPQEWVGKRVEVDLVRPGPTLMGATYQGTLNAVTDLGIVATLSTDAQLVTEERERFYPWSAVLSVDLSG
jgi:hypothetical protein